MSDSHTMNLTYAQAINSVLRRALEEMSDVVLYGEDVEAGGFLALPKGSTRPSDPESLILQSVKQRCWERL